MNAVPRVRGRLAAVAVAVAVTALVVSGTSFAASSSTAQTRPADVAEGSPPAFATIFFGRSPWVGTTGCTPYPDSPTLGDAVGWLSSQGLPASGGVVTGYTAENAETCAGYLEYPSWTELEELHSAYGFEAVSQSATYHDWLDATDADAIRQESCATLGTFGQHGFHRAWGMFAYPNNAASGIQQRVVPQCFAFGRKYGDQPLHKGVALEAPYFARSVSVTSGNCNDPSAACYDAFPEDGRYMTPEDLRDDINPASNQYSIIQFYRFVTGAFDTGKVSWDCTSDDPDQHWVSMPEVYCYNDFQAIVGERGPGVVFTDPASVAKAWGINASVTDKKPD